MERPDPGARDRQLLSRLRVGFVVLVGVSAGLVASYAEGSLPQILVAMAAGAVVGVLLVWLAFPTPTEGPQRARGRR
jgi:uncharacterized membrane protein YjjP (DUF1212 family)